MTSFRRFLDSIAEAGWDILVSRGLASASHSRDIAEICRSLISNRAEVVGVALARQLFDSYRVMEQTDRLAFFQTLRDHFSPDDDAIRRAIDAYTNEPTPENAQNLQEAAEAPRQSIIRALNAAPDAIGAMVRMREDLLAFTKDDPDLRVVDHDFQHVFASWFNKGFLELRRIDWNSPASILEQLIRYEAVHDIQGWDDLRRRLADDRRCYGFFHPALPNQILIFIEVALTREVSADVRELIESDVDPNGATSATTAIFYSINNCQSGLRGISFGNFLIKRVVAQLQSELPALRKFSTLSPIPGFARWLEKSDEELDQLKGSAELRNQHTAKTLDPLSLADADQEGLQQLCAHYLVTAKARDGKPKDPVARFHLGNGARLERINWMGDRSKRGLEQSFGMLVNYVYELEELERNHEAFHEMDTVLHGKSVQQLLPGRGH